MNELLQGVRSLLFPTACLGCQDPLADGESPLCGGCLPKLPLSKAPWCCRCGRSLFCLGAGAELCLECRRRPPSFDQAVSPLLYDGLGKELVTQLKYQNQLRLIPFLTQLLFSAVQERFGSDPADSVVPVPLHPTRLRERTFNQAELLARSLARLLHLPCEEKLIRRKPTLPQTQLGHQERRGNVREAFALKPNSLIRDSRILLVDDVFTTGATVDACAKLLKEGGAGKILVATLAHG